MMLRDKFISSVDVEPTKKLQLTAERQFCTILIFPTLPSKRLHFFILQTDLSIHTHSFNTHPSFRLVLKFRAFLSSLLQSMNILNWSWELGFFIVFIVQIPKVDVFFTELFRNFLFVSSQKLKSKFPTIFARFYNIRHAF